MLLLADAGNWKVGVPGLTYSLRGLAGVDVRAARARRPACTVGHGGRRSCPTRCSRWRGCSRRSSTSTAIPRSTAAGTTTQPPDDAERARLDALPHNVDRLRADWGVRDGVELAGDPDAHVFERLWLRPAITVIGIDGHPIAGSSNQIVAEAAARISVRVGRGQDPNRLNDALAAHLERRVPLGLELTVTPIEAVPAWHCDPTGWAFDAATRALRAPAFGTDPVCMGVGGTIPFVGPFAGRVRRHPRAAARPRRSREPHPRRGREPPPRRLALPHPQRDRPAAGTHRRRVTP